jgi:hypothetical protein
MSFEQGQVGAELQVLAARLRQRGVNMPERLIAEAMEQLVDRTLGAVDERGAAIQNPAAYVAKVLKTGGPTPTVEEADSDESAHKRRAERAAKYWHLAAALPEWGDERVFRVAERLVEEGRKPTLDTIRKRIRPLQTDETDPLYAMDRQLEEQRHVRAEHLARFEAADQLEAELRHPPTRDQILARAETLVDHQLERIRVEEREASERRLPPPPARTTEKPRPIGDVLADAYPEAGRAGA